MPLTRGEAVHGGGEHADFARAAFVPGEVEGAKTEKFGEEAPVLKPRGMLNRGENDSSVRLLGPDSVTWLDGQSRSATIGPDEVEDRLLTLSQLMPGGIEGRAHTLDVGPGVLIEKRPLRGAWIDERHLVQGARDRIRGRNRAVLTVITSR